MSDRKPLFVGQLNTPDPATTRQAFADIFERRFYTNHGPLVADFEAAVAARLGVRHAICMTNGTVALMVAAKCADLGPKVIVPAYTFPATIQAMTFAGIEPVFCDVDPDTHNLTPGTVLDAIEPGVSAIVGVHLWGAPVDVDGLSALARDRGLGLAFDSAHAFGSTYKGGTIGGFGRFEVFSFHATKILNCAEGGCVTTNDDDLADAIRTAANFHDSHSYCDVPLRVNAKMSEAQAAMGLISLAEFDHNVARNRHRYVDYRDRLGGISGLRFVDHARSGASNYQYVVIEIEPSFPLSQAELLGHLRDHDTVARRYFYPGMHRATPYDGREWSLPVTDALCERVLQLPSGEMVTDEDAARVCDLIRAAAEGTA